MVMSAFTMVTAKRFFALESMHRFLPTKCPYKYESLQD